MTQIAIHEIEIWCDNQETGVISTNYSVVGDETLAIQALIELISGVREA